MEINKPPNENALSTNFLFGSENAQPNLQSGELANTANGMLLMVCGGMAGMQLSVNRPAGLCAGLVQARRYVSEWNAPGFAPGHFTHIPT